MIRYKTRGLRTLGLGRVFEGLKHMLSAQMSRDLSQSLCEPLSPGLESTGILRLALLGGEHCLRPPPRGFEGTGAVS